jgi:chromate reductase
MTKIFGLSGSLREGSFNAGLLRAAAEVVPDGTDVIVGTIRGVPLYDGDVEATTEIPAEAQRLKDQLTAADALLLVTPEYNNGVPGVLRNAIDWMTRPASDILGLFGGKPVAVIGASPRRLRNGPGAEPLAARAATLGTKPGFGGRMLVSRAGFLFQRQGRPDRCRHPRQPAEVHGRFRRLRRRERAVARDQADGGAK